MGRHQDILKEHGKQHGFEWVETRPSNIIRAVAGNFMNDAIAYGCSSFNKLHGE